MVSNNRGRTSPEDSEARAVGQATPEYIGVVAGGYDEPIPTDSFKVTVNPDTPARISPSINRWGVVRVETSALRTDGSRYELSTFGIIDDVKVLPGHAFKNSREMAQSSYYREEGFTRSYSSVAEDALELTVRSLGHTRTRGEYIDLYGPVKPPERESRVFVASPDEVQYVFLRPFDRTLTFRVGAYSTFFGLYRPVTEVILPFDQFFLHGAVFATTGWGKTVLIKHLVQELRRRTEPPPPAIIIFNLKRQDFYDLDRPLEDGQWTEMLRWNPDVHEVWGHFQYQREGIPSDRIGYYPVGREPRGRRGLSPCSILFAELGPDDSGEAMMRLFFGDRLYEASMGNLIRYLFFFKQHFTRNYTTHSNGNPGQPMVGPSRITTLRPVQDTLASFRNVLERAHPDPRADAVITCSSCNEQISIHQATVQPIVRELLEVDRLHIFDLGPSINLQHLVTNGRVSVIDMVPVTSPRAQELYIQFIIRSLFNYVNRELYDRDTYQGIVIFLDEAWRFFRSRQILDEVEAISRMGRSLRMGLWLADQNIPTGSTEQLILSNIRTRILGPLTLEPSIIKRVIPLDDKTISTLTNLPRGMGIFYNQELSRTAVPFIVPSCRCYHEG